MNDSNIAPADRSPESAAAAVPAAPKVSRWPALLAFLSIAAVIGLAGVAQLYWQGVQERLGYLHQVIELARGQQAQLAGQVAQTSEVFAEQKARLQAQEALIHTQAQAIAAREAKLEADARRLARQEDAVRQTLENLQREVGRSGQQWRAAEAAYLVDLAHQRLALEADIATALKALEGADQRLAETGDLRWAEVRRRLADDRGKLSGIRSVDRAALADQLLRMVAGVKHLPLHPRQRVPSPGSRQEGPPSGAGGRSLDALLKNGFAGLKSLFQIRRSDAPYATLPGADQQYQAYQHLRLQLDTARFAVLRRDRALYDSSLDTAVVWLNTFFKPGAAETNLYLDDIAKLKAARIAPRLPDLKPTLQALRALLDEGVLTEKGV